jgi:hypothetical protein
VLIEPLDDLGHVGLDPHADDQRLTSFNQSCTACHSETDLECLFGSGTDILRTNIDARFSPESGHPVAPRLSLEIAYSIILAPIFEADLPAEQHGYRPERSALSAVQETRDLLVTGRTQIVDADLTDYFGSIPHAQLMKSVARRVVDRHVLHLLKM